MRIMLAREARERAKVLKTLRCTAAFLRKPGGNLYSSAANSLEAAEAECARLREALAVMVESAEAYRLYSTELGGVDREVALLHARNAARAALVSP